MGLIQYVRNGLPQITMGEILTAGAIIVAGCKAVEDIFGKKYLGSWVWNGIKKIILTPVTINHKLDALSEELKFVREEVQYNGGKIKLRDAVEKIAVNVDKALMQAKVNGFKMTELETRSKIAEECDPTLIFKMDENGGCIYCNQSFYKYFGFAESDIADFNWENVIKDSELPEVRKRWERAYATKSQFFSIQTISNSEGKEIVCRVIGLPIVLDDILKGYYGTITPE